MSSPEWDIERADLLARKALDYLEKVYPIEQGLRPLAPYHELVLAAEAAGDLAAYQNALRMWMRAGRRVARETRFKESGLHVGSTVLGPYYANVSVD